MQGLQAHDPSGVGLGPRLPPGVRLPVSTERSEGNLTALLGIVRMRGSPNPLSKESPMNVLRALTLSTILGAGFLIGTPPQATAQELGGIKVVVDNHAYADMHVYVVHSGRRWSLGLATGLSKRSFMLPRIVAESERDIQLLADPIGSRAYYLTDVFYLYPGTQLNLTLRNNLGLSSATVSDQLPPLETAP